MYGGSQAAPLRFNRTLVIVYDESIQIQSDRHQSSKEASIVLNSEE